MKTVWILGDQLSTEHAALGLTNSRESRVLMVESKARGSALRYHKLKLVLVYSAMRHFARDLRETGWEVDYQLIEGTALSERVFGATSRSTSQRSSCWRSRTHSPKPMLS